ncbi:MAG: CARDB domain-containing protein, partial [Candidatus Micrarchaeia archaeon]
GTARAENVWVKITGENTTYHKISSISPQGRGYINLWLPLPAHEISVIAIADPNNTISELNETNNIANRSIKKVSALPDLSVSEADVTHLPSNPKSGSAVVVSAKIRNYGISIARNITVCFYKADEPHAYEKENWESDEVIILNWDRSRLADLLHEIKRRKGDSAIFGEMLANYTINAIAPNSSQIAKAVVSLPQNASSMRIAVILDPENYIMEASEENNRAIHEIPIEVVYADLMLNSSSISFSPQYATAGNRVLISATVRNNGSLTARNITAFLYFLAGAKEYELVGNTTIPVIPAKGVGTVKFEWTAPRDVKAASFRVEVNPDRRTPESDYRNNIAEKNLTILLPDVELSGKDIWVVGNVSVGNQVWIKANVSNNGNFTARDFDTEFIYVSPSGVETPIGTKTATISAGGTETVSIQWKVPERISANPIIVVRANPSHSLSELDYDNNVGTITLNASLPDIVLSLSANKQNATIPTAPDRRNWVVLSAIVRNIGNAKAHNISVYIMKNGEKIWEEIIPVLNAGENATVNYNFAVLSTMPAGEHFFSAVADQHNTISEINENNNYAEMSLLFVENMRPTAVINADKTNVMKRELITFNCLNSTDPDGKGPFTCRWNFGDGSEVVEGHEVYHSYSASGGYIVVLTVTDSYGAKDSEILRITVQPNKPPIANIGGPYIPYVNEEAYFSPLDSYDPDGEIVLVSWDFGDGSGVETHGFYPVSHTYSNIGTYILKITVTDDSGATSTASTAVIPIYPPEMETKRSTEYYVSHTRYYYSVPSSAYIYYGVYRIDYELKYTPDDNVIRSLKYTIYSGPAIVTTVVDTRASVLFWDIPVTTTTGWTALSVKNVKIVDADGNLLWSAVGGPSINGVERNATMSYTNIEVPIDFSKSNYVTVVSDIDYPANMCAAEHYDCQSNRVALWRI